MSFIQLIVRGLTHHWRLHAGMFLGVWISAVVMSGAVTVGDSVRTTLRRAGEARLGGVRTALVGGERFFRAELAQATGGRDAAMIATRGSATVPDGSVRANSVQVYGVDSRFWAFSPDGARREIAPAECAVNEVLAARLGVKGGDTLVVRVEKASALSKDAPLSGKEDEVEGLRVRVAAVLDRKRFGAFGLSPVQVPGPSVFFDRAFLADRMGAEGKANVLLSGEADLERLEGAVKKAWRPEDSGLEVRAVGVDGQGAEVRSGRVFLDREYVDGVAGGRAVLTYFVNEIRSGDRVTPYSMVSALPERETGPVFPGMASDEAVVTRWVADDLGLKVGGTLELVYLVSGGRRDLEEKRAAFRVARILEMDAPGVEAGLMPDFPGIADAGSCRDWKPGFAIQTERIRDRDEEYWKKYRGTPKVFVGLEAGRALWKNRWGSTTAVRVDRALEGFREEVAAMAAQTRVGVRVVDLAGAARQAVDSPVDFAGLFGGFSFFLIVSAVVLAFLLQAISMQQRTREAGTLLALGFTNGQVFRVFVGEAVGVVLLATVIGTVCGVEYAAVILRLMQTTWKGVASGVVVEMGMNPVHLVWSGVGVFVAAALGGGRVVRRWMSGVPRQLLEGREEAGGTVRVARGGAGWRVATGVLLAGTGAALSFGPGAMGEGGTERFFGHGALVLAGGLLAFAGFLRWCGGRKFRGRFGLALRYLGDRPSRPLSLAMSMAAGTFLVVGVECFHRTSSEADAKPSGGTGGFALMGESALPVYVNLNKAEVLEEIGVDVKKVAGAEVVGLRVREGDEASCLNLNRAVEPKVFGVPRGAFAEKGAFRFAAGSGWEVLDAVTEEGVIPVVADEATARWSLQKGMHDVVTVREGGRTVRMRIEGMLSGSVLQGVLLMREEAFMEAFPDAGGQRQFLIRLGEGAGDVAGVAAAFTKALRDRGLELRSTMDRLAELRAVENTYLLIFQILGGLGVVLATCATGVIALRHGLERRAELAMLEAVGWTRGRVRAVLRLEHVLAVLAGAVTGAGASLVATVPALMQQGRPLDPRMLWGVPGVLVLVALVSLWVAVAFSVRSRALDALRRE
ncbi:MAG: hypothetical protein RIS92_134 [Verrucomicrobiota bacterium]